MKKNMAIGIIGAGKWGKNLIREFNKISTISMCAVTKNSKNKEWLKKNYSRIKITMDYRDIISNPDITAVVIATPIKTHHKIATEALLAGKNVFIEKPITSTSKQAKELTKLAKKRGLTIFVGHVFLYHEMFKKIEQLLTRERLKYLEFNWDKLGTFNEDIYLNLLSHDIAIALKLLGKIKRIQPGHVQGALTSKDVVHIKAASKNKTNCTFHINRISNEKRKSITIITDKNIYVWGNDSLHKLNKKGGGFIEVYKSKKTALEIECIEFIKHIKLNTKPVTDGNFGIQVLAIIEKIDS
ncbi:Gfo/Idh/MocA family protein [Patescibacteria group bacterium]